MMTISQTVALYDHVAKVNLKVFLVDMDSGVAGPLAAWCGGQICRPNFLGFGQVAQLSQRDRATRQLLRFADLRCGIF